MSCARKPTGGPVLLWIVVALLAQIAASANAALTDLASAPLSSSASAVVKPNLLFTLDASGSMAWDFLPDNVNPDTSNNVGLDSGYTCRNDSNGNNNCKAGEPPYYAPQFNGVAYNPQYTYRPGVNFDATSRGNMSSPWTSVAVNSYDGSQGNINLTNNFPEVVYCNASNLSVCKRNGIDNGSTFSYATAQRPSLSSVSFSRSGSTVTGTKANHGISVGDVIDVVGAGGCSTNAVSVTAVSANTFSFTAGDASTPSCASGTVNYAVVGYPEQSSVSFQTSALSKSGGTVTVTYPNHRMILGDLLDVSAGGGNCTAAGTSVTGVTANTLTFSVGGGGSCSGTYTIARRAYKYPKNAGGRPFYYTIAPIEYCSDQNLTLCVASSSPTSVSGVSYAYPAYVRYCSSSALALAAAPVSGGSPASCNSKYFGSYTYPRYGRFTRMDIVPTTATYTGRPLRPDCSAAPNCTFTEEMTNFANWYAYYRTRIQMMKSSGGIAFTGVDDRYRVGFITLSPGSNTANPVSAGNPVSASRYLAINTFNTTQKQSFYNLFYSQTPSNSTPLRGALARAGRHFAGKQDGVNSGMSGDPIQYSCQQNFVLLTTDGYWNTNSNGDTEPVQLDGSTVIGNQDNTNAGLSTRAAGAFDGGCGSGNYNSGGCSNTLADVAMYYYKTDLRGSGSIGALGADVSTDNVPTTPQDTATWQHMTTFTLGLADGLLTWQPDYASATSGDFYRIRTNSTGCWWSGAGSCNWPTPKHDTPTALDDLWHAAVNGRGSYFHASDPQSLSTGLAGALAGLNVRTAAAAASATSSPNITQQDNVIFSSTYETVEWTGELTAQNVDPATGNVVSTVLWSSQASIDGQVAAASDTRAIYTFSSAAGGVKAFTWSNLSASEQAYFNNACVPATKLSQCSSLSLLQLLQINNGQNLVGFLRGQTQNQGTLFRTRTHALGDTVDATPAYVRNPRFSFADAVSPSYQSFAIANVNRQPVIYLAANDGMLHAIDARASGGTNGAELWAYVPRMLMPKLYQLAEMNYATKHQFFVDGSPSTMDAYIGGAWRTLLVGGLNGGGRGYYALDVTDPNNPRGLWEFCNDSTVCAISDADLGYTFGNAFITKRASDGRWVVLVTSGYNNVSPGTGQGYLYVLDAATGAVLEKISTGTGTTTTPSGLGRIGAWADQFNLDNTTKYIYAGDLRGNVWRFNLTTSPSSVMQLGSLTDAASRPQSVTTRPELAQINGYRVLYVGTGRYLGTSDLQDPATWVPPSTDAYQQSLYAFKDLGINYGNIRSNATLQQQTITALSATTRSTSNTAVDWASKNGWFVDFNPGNASPGERVNIDPQLILGTLLVVGNVPNTNACAIGGDSWFYQFRYDTGAYVTTAPSQIVASKNTGALIVGAVVVQLPSSSLKSINTDASGNKTPVGINIGNNPLNGRRMSWHELSN